MRVRYTPRAERDLVRIVAYLTERAPEAAALVVRRIRERAAQLTDFPFMGPPTNRPGIRSLTIVPYPYKLYYRVGTPARRFSSSGKFATGSKLFLPSR